MCLSHIMYHLNSSDYYNACEILQIISFPENTSPAHDIRAGRALGLQSQHVSGDVWWEPSHLASAFQTWNVQSKQFIQSPSHCQRETGVTRKSFISSVLDNSLNTWGITLWRSLPFCCQLWECKQVSKATDIPLRQLNSPGLNSHL